MNRGAKPILAVCILLGGIALAMLFRRPSAESHRPDAGPESHLVLREKGGEQPTVTAPIEPPAARIGAPDLSPGRPGDFGRPRREVPPTGYSDRPPTMAMSYPHSDYSRASPETPANDPGSPRRDRPGQALRIHRIVDGDTLKLLAERYLGDADRYLEIYEANRNVLPSPEVLPIGVELKIPLRPARASARQNPVPESPLVPIPASSSARHNQ